MPKERNKADGYREKAYEGDTKAMCRVRRTAVRLIGMAMVWRRTWRNVLSGMSWRPMEAMLRHSSPQAGF